MGDNEQTSQGQGLGAPQPGEGTSEFYNELLSGVPEEHRSTLEPFLKQADAKVTRRFQELSEREKQYNSLRRLRIIALAKYSCKCS